MRNKNCEARQYSDQMNCARCGLVWDVNDPEPPTCATEPRIVPHEPTTEEGLSIVTSTHSVSIPLTDEGERALLGHIEKVKPCETPIDPVALDDYLRLPVLQTPPNKLGNRLQVGIYQTKVGFVLVEDPSDVIEACRQYTYFSNVGQPEMQVRVTGYTCVRTVRYPVVRKRTWLDSWERLQ